MYYEVYLDLFFLMNFWMNIISCRLLTVLLKKRNRIWKICAVSFLSSISACLVMILPVGAVGVRMAAGQIVWIPVLVFILFRDKGAEYIKDLASYYLVMFLIGGAVSYLEVHMTFAGILLSGTAAAAVIEIIYRIWGSRNRKYIYDVMVRCGSNQYVFQALFDSGNRLREPILKEQVHIIGKDAAQKLSLRENAKGVRVIPFHSIGKEAGMMMGYYADEMEVMQEHGELRIEHPLFGVSEEVLSVQNEYEMILNSEIFD